VIRVWDRGTGELHTEGEAAAGLLPAIAWQPNGRHLFAAVSKPAAEQEQAPAAAAAAPQQQQLGKGTEVEGEGEQARQQQQQQREEVDEGEEARQAAAEGIRHVGAWKRELRRRQALRAAQGGSAAASAVLLFELNGLQHGGFEVPAAASGAASLVEQLAWSPDSEFLAVVLSGEDEHGELLFGLPEFQSGTLKCRAAGPNAVKRCPNGRWTWCISKCSVLLGIQGGKASETGIHQLCAACSMCLAS
jgi:pyruvate/2-oxoglutarate dehydrogenase complex dihydrolipoamide acyltransferase (E2) component